MANRREFIQAGAVASIVTGIGLRDAQAGATAAADSSWPIALAVYDERFAEARAFAAESAGFGAQPAAISHDVTRLWLDTLLPRWRNEHIAVAGLTAECSYHCLKWLAWDLGVRTVYHGEHVFEAGHAIRHTLTAPHRQLESRATPAAFQGTAWADSTARLVMGCPSHPRDPRSLCLQSLEEQPSASRELEEALISWVLLPVTRRTGPYGESA